MQHNYFIAWPRIMKIGQIDVLFAVTRSKMKRQISYKDSFKDIMLYYIISSQTIFIGYLVFLFCPSIAYLFQQKCVANMPEISLIHLKMLKCCWSF